MALPLIKAWLAGRARGAATTHIDAPVLEAVEAAIPVGNHVAFVPSVRSKRENERLEEVRLGPATVTGRHGRVYQRGIWLMQFSWYGGQTFLPPSYQIPPVSDKVSRVVERVPGRGISTVVSFNKIYGHALLDELPLLLHLLQSARFERFDTVLSSPLALKLLQRVDDPRVARLLARAKAAERHKHYVFDDLAVVRRTGCRASPSLEELTILRSARRDRRPHGGERQNFGGTIFIERQSKRRQILNQARVDAVLNTYGIAKVAPVEVADPWSLFAAADLVVGVAGSDLSDCAFMRPGAVLLEIHPSDHVKAYNWNVTKTLGVVYHSVIAQSRTTRGTPIGAGNSPVEVDIGAFERQLRLSLGAAQRRPTGP